MHGVGVRAGERDERVSELVVGDDHALGFGEDTGATLKADGNLLHRLLELLHGDRLCPPAFIVFHPRRVTGWFGVAVLLGRQ